MLIMILFLAAVAMALYFYRELAEQKRVCDKVCNVASEMEGCLQKSLANADLNNEILRHHIRKLIKEVAKLKRASSRVPPIQELRVEESVQ